MAYRIRQLKIFKNLKKYINVMKANTERKQIVLKKTKEANAVNDL